MIRLIRYAEPYILGILIAIALLFGQATCDLALPDFMADMVNNGIASGNTEYIIQTGFKMLGVSLLGGICSITVGFIAARIAAGICRQLRIDLFEKVESFSNSEFDQFSTSSLITRTTNDVTQIQTLLFMLIRIVFYAPILGIGGVVHALAESRSMSWIIGVALAVMFGIIGVMMSLALPKFKRIQTMVDKLNQVVRENLDGMLVIRAFNTQRFEEKRFDGVNHELTQTNLFVNRTMAGMMPAMMLVMNLTTVLVIWVGAGQVSAFKLDVGNMMAYMQYVMQIILAFLMMSMMFIMIPRAEVSANRIAEVLETVPSITDPREPVLVQEPLQGVVEFRHVTFAYPEAEDPVLHDISFTARPGQTTAIIGATGCGKSTVVNLIPRFYDVTEGQILIDGVDVRDMRLDALRANLGYVPQKGILFSGTIRSNLAYGDQNASDAELATAADIAQATEFIEAKPGKYDTEIAQGGANVSGGQKQRLSIARALVKRPQIYIFDDSFSALDFKTDAALRSALKKETGGSTIFLVAQRISTIMNAEQIIVLEAGRIAGIGTHPQLMETCQVYREIGLSQLSAEELA